MDWQLIVVGVVVLAACAYMGRRWYRTWFGAGKHGACAGCECAHEPPARKRRPVE
jgi:hypothetical protein